MYVDAFFTAWKKRLKVRKFKFAGFPIAKVPRHVDTPI